MRILLFDGSYLVMRSVLSSYDNELISPEYVKFIVTRMLISELSKSYEATKEQGYPIVAFDYGGSAFRKSMYPQYKADRVQADDDTTVLLMPDGEYQGIPISDLKISSSELFRIRHIYDGEEREYLDSINRLKLFRETREYVCNELNKIGILGLKIHGYEADDIGYLFSNFTSCKGTLVSDDHDWKLNLSNNYDLRRPIKDETVTINSFNTMLGKLYESTNIPGPVLYRHMLALTGTHNNIIGYKGIGEAKAKDILTILLANPELPLDDRLKLLNPKSKIHSKVIDDSSIYQFNYVIVGSDHIAIERNKIFDEILKQMDKVQRPNQFTYLAMCHNILSESLPELSQKYFSSYKYITKDDLKSVMMYK